MKRRNLIFKTLSYIFLILSSFVMIYPVLFMALGAFTTRNRFLDAVILPIPNTLNLDYFSAYFNQGLGNAYMVTLLRVLWSMLITLGVGLIGGYIFSKMHFPGKNRVFLLFLSGMVMPGILMLVPSYLMMAWFPFVGGNGLIWSRGGHGLIDNPFVLFVGGWVPVFAIFLLKQSFDMLPREYEDAAKMDGAGMFTIIFNVYGPLLKPPIVALIIVTFLGAWNDYLWPSMVISGNTPWMPIALRMKYVFITGAFTPLGVVDYPSVMVRTFLTTWPPAAVYFFLQRYFVQGMIISGLKG